MWCCEDVYIQGYIWNNVWNTCRTLVLTLKLQLPQRIQCVMWACRQHRTTLFKLIFNAITQPMSLSRQTCRQTHESQCVVALLPHTRQSLTWHCRPLIEEVSVHTLKLPYFTVPYCCAVIGVSLSEPHTSVTASHTCVSIYLWTDHLS